MENDKKEKNMQSAAHAITLKPMPKKEGKRLVQGEVGLSLWNAIEKELDHQGHTIREALEFGLRAYLLVHNPKEATRLGITNDTP